MTIERGLWSWDRTGQFRGADRADPSAGWRQERRAAGLVVFPDWSRARTSGRRPCLRPCSGPRVRQRWNSARQTRTLDCALASAGPLRRLAPEGEFARLSEMASARSASAAIKRRNRAPVPPPASGVLSTPVCAAASRGGLAQKGRGRPPFWVGVLIVKQFGVFRAGSLRRAPAMPSSSATDRSSASTAAQ